MRWQRLRCSARWQTQMLRRSNRGERQIVQDQPRAVFNSLTRQRPHRPPAAGLKPNEVDLEIFFRRPVTLRRSQEGRNSCARLHVCARSLFCPCGSFWPPRPAYGTRHAPPPRTTLQPLEAQNHTIPKAQTVEQKPLSLIFLRNHQRRVEGYVHAPGGPNLALGEGEIGRF